MSSSIVRRLVLNDLYLLRWMSGGAVAGGLIAIGLMALSPMPMSGGSVLLICALIVLAIFLVMSGVVQERRERVSLFVLSLPVSTTEYVTAKVVANAVAFGIPWLILSVAAGIAIDASRIPNGYLPFWVTLLAYLFFYYCVLLSVGLNTDSTGWHATAITIGNISVNFFIMFLFTRPSIIQYGEGAAAVWTADMAILVIACILGGPAILAIAFYRQLGRAEFA